MADWRPDRKMTPKQERFVDEYMVDCNATQAAIRAGYSPRTSGYIGGQLLTKNIIARAIAEKKAIIAEKVQVTAEDVLRDLLLVKNRCVQEARPKLHFNFETKKTEPVIDDEGNVVFEFDAKSANRALELLGKHLGMFVERRKIETEESVKVILSVLPPEIQEQVVAKLRELAKKG